MSKTPLSVNWQKAGYSVAYWSSLLRQPGWVASHSLDSVLIFSRQLCRMGLQLARNWPYWGASRPSKILRVQASQPEAEAAIRLCRSESLAGIGVELEKCESLYTAPASTIASVRNELMRGWVKPER